MGGISDGTDGQDDLNQSVPPLSMASPYYAQFIPTVSKFRQKSRSTAAHPALCLAAHARRPSSRNVICRLGQAFFPHCNLLHRARLSIAHSSQPLSDRPAARASGRHTGRSASCALLHSISQKEIERLTKSPALTLDVSVQCFQNSRCDA